MGNCVYIISGPPGVGKSSVSEELAYSFDKSAVIEGDSIYLMIFLITFNIVARFHLNVKRFFSYFYNILKKSTNTKENNIYFFEKYHLLFL